MKKVFGAVLVLMLCFTLIACKKKGDTSKDNGTKTTTETSKKDMGDEKIKDKDGNVKRYLVESGIVHFILTGAEEGEETLYFDDWGNIEARHKKTKPQLPGGITLPDGVDLPETNSVSITMGDTIYNYNVGEKTGNKITNTLEFVGDVNKQDLNKLGMEMLEAMDAKKEGTKEIDGETCDRYVLESLNTETCIWMGVTVETLANIAGIEAHVVADSIEANVPIPEDKITVPDDVTFNELGDLNNILENL